MLQNIGRLSNASNFAPINIIIWNIIKKQIISIQNSLFLMIYLIKNKNKAVA
jgi:hypothetical protein